MANNKKNINHKIQKPKKVERFYDDYEAEFSSISTTYGKKIDYSLYPDSENETVDGRCAWFDDKYPSYLYNLYLECGTLQSVLDSSIDFTKGSEMIINKEILPYGFQYVNKFGKDLKDVIEYTIADRWIYGGFALQVEYNELGGIMSLYNIDMRRVRTNRDYSKVWVWQKNNGYIEYKGFNPANGANDGLQIFFYKGTKTRGVYPIPDYVGGIKSAETLVEMQKFRLNELRKNFTGGKLITIKGGKPSEVEKRLIRKQHAECYSGTEHTGETQFVFLREGQEISIENLQGDNLAERYNSSEDLATKQLFISLSAPPEAFGMNVSTGFAPMERTEAFNFYNDTSILPRQNEENKVFKYLLSLPSDLIRFEPFKITSNAQA